MSPAAKSVQLGARVKKLSQDFSEQGGKYRMSKARFRAWHAELATVPAAERPQTAAQLIALAMRFEREGGVPAAEGIAQLYFFAAGLMKGAAGKPRKAAIWGAKKK